MKIYFYITLIGAIISVALNYFMIPIYGIAGAATASVISYLMAPLSLVFFRKTRRDVVEVFRVVINYLIFLKKIMNTENEFTGERYIPHCFTVDEDVSLMHMGRYNFAKDYAKNKIVLDIACGEGYGSSLFSKESKQVIGVDIDESAITNANEKYREDNLLFKIGSVENIPIEDESVDVVASFETIEHVDHKTQLIFIEEVKRVLKRDGIFIISTPDREVFGEGFIPFHIRELNKSMFLKILKKHFINIEFYGQDVKKYGHWSFIILSRFLHWLVRIDKYKLRYKITSLKTRLKIDNESKARSVNNNVTRDDVSIPVKINKDETARFLVAVCNLKR